MAFIKLESTPKNQKYRDATKTLRPKGSQRNDYQPFEISDFLCFCD